MRDPDMTRSVSAKTAYFEANSLSMETGENNALSRPYLRPSLSRIFSSSGDWRCLWRTVLRARLGSAPFLETRYKS